MKRSRISWGVAVALAGMASDAAHAARQGRYFRLSEDAAPGTVRFLSQAIELADGATTSWVTITRTGDFSDPRYGQFSITPTMLAQMVSNFDKRVIGQDVFFDVAHKHSDGAAARVLKLAVEGGKLRALVEWTPFGVDAVNNRGFAYLSAEFHENWIANEAGSSPSGCVLLGAGLTIRPVIKGMDPVRTLSTDDNDHTPPVRLLISPNLLKQLSEPDNTMNKHLKALLARLITLGYTDATAKPLLDAAEKQLTGQTDETKCLSVVDSFAAAGDAAMVQIKAAGGDGKNVTITLAAPQPALNIDEAVTKALAARDTADALAKTTLAGKHKLLSDTITAGDNTLPADGVVKLSAEYAPLITASSTDDQVKHLASLALAKQQEISSAVKLAGLGYHIPGGDIRIVVDSSNEVKSLQQTVDRRLGFEEMSPSERYKRTGGVLLAANAKFAEKTLAQFDALNGHRLHAEHRMLAAGTGLTSDVAVPAIAERTVLRESLYEMKSLNFMNVGTAPFAQVLTIPYSYRDTSAAGASALRIYEGQGIRNAGVIQTQEEARPTPQKLAFTVSEEMRMLLSASVIDFDPVAENIRNIIRIVGEDTEALNCNELVFSADEAGATGFTNTLTAQCDGTNAVFVTTVFPVVRPRKAFDLKGVQQGATLNPLTVTLGGTARAEYALPADGSALPNATYYVMDWNLGELRFVDQTGAKVVPANTTELVVTGSYSTNAVKFDTDAVNGEDVKDRYDRLLTVIGSRKAVINSDRYYNANMVLMSATVDNAISQARSFEANASRVATGLGPDGSVGQIKSLPTFNTTAPGLVMGDTRILLGERGNARFRMVKPFTMNPLEQARNAAGQFIDAKQSFGVQWVVSHTPTQLKNALTSVVLYSATGRVARA